ncbi:MAG: tail fiber protein [Oceanicaulis sp.]
MKNAFLTATALALTAAGTSAHALDPFIGQIDTFPYNFCPYGWQEADGALLSIAQNTALYSLYGTFYGGNGQTTFALPNLSGRMAIGDGSMPGGPTYQMGQTGGASTITLTLSQLPAHSHSFNGSTAAPTEASLVGHTFPTYPGPAYAAPGQSLSPMKAGSIGSTGGGQPMSVQGPYLSTIHCVALVGIYPSRN